MKIKIQKVESETLDIVGEKIKVSDDGKGHLEIKSGSTQVGWFHFNSGFLVYDTESITLGEPAASAAPSPPAPLRPPIPKK